MKKEKEFFDCFTEKEDDYLPSFCRHAFYRDGYVIATDRAILVRAPYESLRELYVNEDKNPKGLPDFPASNCSFNLPLNILVDTIKSIPAEETIAVEGKAAECDECEGTGSVEWTYEDYDGNEHKQDFDCPVCGGRGRVKTKKFRREWRYISINGVRFLVRPLMKLAKAMDMEGFDSVEIKNLPPGQTPALMCLEGGIDILIMPSSQEAKPIREINI